MGKWQQRFEGFDSLAGFEEELQWALEHEDILPEGEWHGALVITMEYQERTSESVQSSPEPTPVTEPTKSKPVTEKPKDYLDLALHFASKSPPPKRERIRDALADALGSEVPESDYLLKTWERAVDGLVVEFRKMCGVKRLNEAVVEAIMGAIKAAKANGGWQLDANEPNRAVVGAIVEAGRKVKGEERAGVDLAAFKAEQKKRIKEMERTAHGH